MTQASLLKRGLRSWDRSQASQWGPRLVFGGCGVMGWAEGGGEQGYFLVGMGNKACEVPERKLLVWGMSVCGEPEF